MPERVPLPPHLRGSSFRVSDRQLHELRDGRLRSADLDRPFHGIRSVDLRLDDPLDRARIYAPRLRKGQRYSHVTAAQLWDIPLPLELSRATEVHVGAPSGAAPRTRGVVGHRVADAPPSHIEQLPLCSPAEVWCQLASLLSREDLVAAGDYLVSSTRLKFGARRPRLCSLADLERAAQRFGRQPGAASIRWALPRIRSGVDSRRETLLRLAIVARRMPEPTIAHPVTVAFGRVLHPDLSYPWAMVAIEYEGDEHRQNTRRWRDDLRRVVLLEQAGWRVIRATELDIQDPTVLVAAIRTALSRAVAAGRVPPQR